jgi:hypothetical protein
MLPGLAGLPIAARKNVSSSLMSGFADNSSKMMQSIIADATNRAWQNAQLKQQNDMSAYNQTLQNLQSTMAIKAKAAESGIYYDA